MLISNISDKQCSDKAGALTMAVPTCLLFRATIEESAWRADFWSRLSETTSSLAKTK